MARQHQSNPKQQGRDTPNASQKGPGKTIHRTLQRAQAQPGTLTGADVQLLQRALGNRATQRLIQAKLKLGPAGDACEQEADQMARQVVRSFSRPQPVPGGEQATNGQATNGQATNGQDEPVQREEMGEEEALQMKPLAADISPRQRMSLQKPSLQLFAQEEEEALQAEREPVQKQGQHGPEGGLVEAGVEATIQQAKGGGRPLADGLRAKMESGFGADFSRVRVHTGNQAEGLNRSLNARAFTTGGDIFFGQGQYNPGSSSGQELIAHELTHTVQQGASTAQGGGDVQAKPTEARKQPAQLISRSPEQVQRRIGFELETGIPVMYERQEDTEFEGMDNDDLEANFPGGKLMVDHLPGHTKTDMYDFDEWNIIEFVTDPLADDLQDNQFEGVVRQWLADLQGLRDYAMTNFDYINHAPKVGAPKYPDTVISLPTQNERNAYTRWNRMGPQATMGIKLSKVGTALGNTDPGRNWAGTTKYNRVVEGAQKAGPAAADIVNRLRRSYPPTQNRTEGITDLQGFLTLVLNYLLSGKATGTAGYIKNRSVFMYKSKLSSLRNSIINQYYAEKILNRYPKRRRALRNRLLKDSKLAGGDEIYKGAEFNNAPVLAGTWVDEVLAGTEDRLFEAMKNPWSNEIAPEAVHGEQGAVMEMRDFSENQINVGNISLDQDDAIVNLLLQVYRLNRQWATQ